MKTLTPELPLRGPQCPAPFVLEAFSAGEPQGDSVTTHLEGCAACAGYIAALTDGREAFLALRPAPQFLRKLEARTEKKPVRSPWLFGLTALLTAGLAVAVVPSLLTSDPLPDDGITLKGRNAALQVVFLRPGSDTAQLVEPDARLKAGDALRFAFAAPKDGHLLILDLDGTGKASVFVPYGGSTSRPVPAGDRELMPGSVVLDDAPGPEWIVSVFSPKPLEAAPLLAALEAQSGADNVKLQCEGCEVTTLRIQKTP